MFISFSGQLLVLCKLNMAFIISKLYHVYRRLYGLLMGNKKNCYFISKRGPNCKFWNILEVYNIFIFYSNFFPLNRLWWYLPEECRQSSCLLQIQRQTQRKDAKRAKFQNFIFLIFCPILIHFSFFLQNAHLYELLVSRCRKGDNFYRKGAKL